MAAQAPTGSNAQGWHFVVVTDADKRAKLAEMYREGFQIFYGDREAALAGMPQEDPDYLATQTRVVDSAGVPRRAHGRGAGPRDPVHRGPGRERPGRAARLASGDRCCRRRGTSASRRAPEASAPAGRRCTSSTSRTRPSSSGCPTNVMQGALIPVAHTKGTDFKPGPRRDLDRVLHLEGW